MAGVKFDDFHKVIIRINYRFYFVNGQIHYYIHKDCRSDFRYKVSSLIWNKMCPKENDKLIFFISLEFYGSDCNSCDEFLHVCNN